jgi:hypothetical protein
VSQTRRWTLTAGLAAVVAAGTLRVVRAAEPAMLVVEVTGELPGFKNADLPRFVARQMAAAGVGEWRFRPRPLAAMEVTDWVQWRFRRNAYAGGDLRRVIPIPSVSRTFGAHYLVTAELRLFLGGQYETMTFGQATVQGGDQDPDLAEFLAKVTQALLGPAGAYRALMGPAAGASAQR